MLELKRNETEVDPVTSRSNSSLIIDDREILMVCMADTLTCVNRLWISNNDGYDDSGK